MRIISGYIGKAKNFKLINYIIKGHITLYEDKKIKEVKKNG